MASLNPEAPLYNIDESDAVIHDRGIIAQASIPSGTLIFSEKPLLSVHIRPPTLTLDKPDPDDPDTMTDHKNLIKDFHALPQDEKDLILDMDANEMPAFKQMIFLEFRNFKHAGWSNIERKNKGGPGAKQILTTFDTNAIGGHLGILTAMLNHSCLPNAYAAFEETTGQMMVHAVRDIEKGEEICISYLQGTALFHPGVPNPKGIVTHDLDLDEDLRRKPMTPLVTRHEFLQLQRGFNCLCVACKSEASWVANGGDLKDHPEEKLRAKLRHLLHTYKVWDGERRGNQLATNRKNRSAAYKRDQKLVGRLASLCTVIVEVLEELGLETMDHLEWHQAGARWEKAVKKVDVDALQERQEYMLAVVKKCIGEESQMYTEMWKEVYRVPKDIDQRLGRVGPGEDDDDDMEEEHGAGSGLDEDDAMGVDENVDAEEDGESSDEGEKPNDEDYEPLQVGRTLRSDSRRK